jgi:RNA polymerase-interacting CarD/CdnL/TRCF family regulator
MTFDEMDKAAEEFAKELDGLPKDAVKMVADLWQKHYLKAGHKRLARKLLAKANSQFVEELAKLVKD